MQNQILAKESTQEPKPENKTPKKRGRKPKAKEPEPEKKKPKKRGRKCKEKIYGFKRVNNVAAFSSSDSETDPFTSNSIDDINGNI
jgi:hypothetical protein